MSWTAIPVAFVAGMVSFLAPCVLPLVPIPLCPPWTRTSSGSREPLAVSSSRACRSCSASRRSSCFSASAPRSWAVASSPTSSCSSESVASSSSCSVSHSWDSCRGRSACWAPGCSREREAVARAFSSAGRSPFARHRVSGPCSAAILVLAGSAETARRRGAPRHLLARLAVPFVLAGAVFTRAMSAFRWLRDHYRSIQIAGGAIMVALGLLLFFERFYVLRVYLNRFLDGSASSLPSDQTRGAGAREALLDELARARATSSSTTSTSTPRCCGRYEASRRAAFLSWRSQPGLFSRRAWCQATAT